MRTKILSDQKENQLIIKAYTKLLRQSRSVISKDDSKIIKKAFRISLDAHKNMRRKSGEPYILHPISVAQICVSEIGLGTTAIIAALLHDVVEDTDITLEYIEKEFGERVAKICDGLTKISGVLSPGSSIQSENFRKMLLTLVDDVLLNKMIANDNVNNEQIALGYLVKNHPDDFAVYSRTNGQHMDIFTELIE